MLAGLLLAGLALAGLPHPNPLLDGRTRRCLVASGLKRPGRTLRRRTLAAGRGPEPLTIRSSR